MSWINLVMFMNTIPESDDDDSDEAPASKEPNIIRPSSLEEFQELLNL